MYSFLLDTFWENQPNLNATPAEMAIYFALLNECRRHQWQEQFPMSLNKIELLTGLSRHTILACRLRLVEFGLITFVTHIRGRGCKSLYSIKRCNDCTLYNKKGAIKSVIITPFRKEKNKEKENVPPAPPLKEKENKKEKETLASLVLTRTRTHEDKEQFNSIDSLRATFSSRMATEQLMMSLKIPDKGIYRQMCEEILAEWTVSFGVDFPMTSDRKQHFINLLRRKWQSRQQAPPPSKEQRRIDLMQAAVDDLNRAINEQPLTTIEDDDTFPF